MSYQPIESYGIIGDMHTVALVGMDGSIDWLCLPRFDSPSIFAAILDDAKGGRFAIHPTGEDTVHKQLYWPDTNILVTRFLSKDGVGEIVDFMPVDPSAGGPLERWLIRRVQVVRGSMQFRLLCRPAFDYGRQQHEVHVTGSSACFLGPGQTVELSGDVPLSAYGPAVTAEFDLRDGDVTTFLFRNVPKEACGEPMPETRAEELFRSTAAYWRRWIGKCTYKGRWREMVERSALALKLMTYEPTGAVVASPTCSLPETLGGVRNWDYRYTWLRDAAFTLYAFLRIGFTEEAAQFVNWLEARCHDLNPDGSLQIMYGLDGHKTLVEETLDHLEGYRGSKPVRIGNGAYNQLQLDIYGELMDSVYIYNKHGSPISADLWQHLRRLVNWVADNWERPDEGIWEVRGGRQHFVYSKLMCWVALDRALRLADKRSFPADRVRWIQIRDKIYEQILTEGWNQRKQSFVQHYGSDSLDASNLIMPLVFFMSPTDPRMLKTLDAMMKPPAEGGLVSNSLVYRYDQDTGVDGLAGEEGTFNMCTFWLVEALTRAGRVDRSKLDEARLMFEKMLGYANHLGLYAEETGPRGEGLGNFPQAFTHLSLISAAFNLDRALSQR